MGILHRRKAVDASRKPPRTADALVRSQNAGFMGIMHGPKAL
jgi:hypothetical protein